MALSNPVPIPNPTEGVIRSGAIEDVVSQQDSVQEGLNVHYDRMGATTVRPGIAEYANQMSSGPIYLGGWYSTDSLAPQLLAQFNSNIFAWYGGTWTDIGTNSTADKVRSTSFINWTFFVNGNAGDPMMSYDGTTYSTANTDSMPPGDFIESGIGNRLWVADQSTGRIWYSDQIPIGAPLTTGLYPNNYIYISPNNGQRITGLKTYSSALLVFFNDYIYRIYDAFSNDAYPAFFVGTSSQESIVQAKDTLYFHHPSGFYRMTLTSQPQEISRRIIDIIYAIPASNYPDIFGWNDSDHVYWCLGNMTVGDMVYQNLVCRYTISTQVWTLYDYFSSNLGGQRLTAAYVFNDGLNIYKIAGVSDGSVVQLDSGTTDLGEPIFYYEIGRWLNISQLQSKYQKISQVGAMHQNAAGAKLDAQIDHDVTDKWTNLGTYNNEFATLFQSFELDPFNRLRFRKSGYSSGTAPIFGTLEILGFEDVGFKVQ